MHFLSLSEQTKFRGIMGIRVRYFSVLLVFLCCLSRSHAENAFDLSGPRLDIKVTRGGKTLPISQVPNLQPGDRVWVRSEMPESQSVHYLLVAAFLRGSTNPPPEHWLMKA